MNISRVLALVLIAAALSGCLVRGKKTAAAPVAPAPTLPPAPAPPQPLSEPQTTVELPAPQPLNPGALATAPEPQPVPPPAGNIEPPQRAPRRSSTTVAPKPAEPPAAPPVAQERSRIQEIVPAEQMRQLQQTIDARRREIQVVLDQAARRRLNRHEETVAGRVRSFLQQVEEAVRRGDMLQADSLSNLALILAGELKVAQ